MGQRKGRRRLTRKEKIEVGSQRAGVGGQGPEIGSQRSEVRDQRDVEKVKIRSISPEARKIAADISNRYGLRLNDILI